MLPFDQRPWAKAVATIVIVLSIAAGVIAALYWYQNDSLHISEILIIVLSLLTIVPPNLAIVLRKSSGNASATSGTLSHIR